MIKINNTNISDIKIDGSSVNKVLVGSTVVWQNEEPHQYVDLGLPSGTLWATTNIGADYPQDCGLWFQWGDVQGYTSEQVGNEQNQKAFSWTDYKYSANGTGAEDDMTKYNNTDGLVTLSPEDDAATVNWGDLWCMPKRWQIEALCNNCTTSVVSIKKVGTVDDYITCIKFTSNINNNELIFPCLGRAYEGSVGTTNSMDIWSSTLNTSKMFHSFELLVEDFTSVYKKNTLARNRGLNIRPVLKQN